MLSIFSFLNIIIIAYLFLKNNLCIRNSKSQSKRKSKSVFPVYTTILKDRRGNKISNVKSAHIKIIGFTQNIKGKTFQKGEKRFLIEGKKIYSDREKKKKWKKLFAEGNFFNPKQFKNLFPDEPNKKGKTNYNENCLNLEEVENLKEICPSLYEQLEDYHKSEGLEELKEEEIPTEKREVKEYVAMEHKTKEEEEEVSGTKNISVYEGLPLLMIDGKDFQGFPDSRKIKIKPEISTQFSNLDYDKCIKSNSEKKYMGDSQKGLSENVNNGQMGKGEKGENGQNGENAIKTVRNTADEKGMLNEFEREVQLVLGKEDRSTSDIPKGTPNCSTTGSTDCRTDTHSDDTKGESLTKEERIAKYKKFGKHHHMDSALGDVLYDRDYPGYIYLNHGENLKELDEKSEFDSEFPSYINPSNIHLRTGRKREVQKIRDSGIKQKRRWGCSKIENDIKRGNWRYYDDMVKDLLDSTDQEKLEENYYSNNYYQRTHNNTGFGSLDKVQNNYFDVQFIGSAETYPANISVGMNFIWPINFIPLLCKQYTKRSGQPIKSEIFNLGGFDSLQLWFYPDGMNNSIDGYCALKLVMKPGSYLPVKIFFFAFSEYNYIHTNSFYKESADYITSSLNLCKCLLKTKVNLKRIENNKDYVILGPAGNIYIGVGIFDDNYDFEEDFKKFYSLNNKYKNKKKVNHKFEYKYDWDEGVHIFDNWLKKQTAITDDKNELLPVYYTHSELYENYKYQYIPEKNPLKFLNRKKDKHAWNRHPF
ncbi:conserved Plasmodium protein, unknown function [Plasmodium malariae]|uniref:Uncharacterized protein n=1 Tax=Plasmodium malariae TaxID=5858 RepID=A0A1D3TEY3_PLAMA|nr:conserved Plasmodium protein, unknown function [Plasmodium malariae]SCP03502.1 conserved Plasmodium protein, unknown function [Plasmodium malariae]